MLAKYFLATLALMTTQTAFGAVIGTLFGADASGSTQSTLMLDIEVLNPSGITIRSIDLNNRIGQQDGVAFTLDVYITPSTYVGQELNSAAWTLVGSGAGVGAPEGTPVPVDISDFFLAQGTYGIAFHAIGFRQGYTQGANSYSNADAVLTTGAAAFGLFSGTLNVDRTWNGNIYYDVRASGVPEPSSGMLLGLGVAGLGLARHLVRRKQS